ncbi:MAG: APC family permease, partial [Vulcanimicrobiaceae bacterium]
MKRPRALPRVLGLLDVGILSSASMGPAYSLASTMGPMVAAAGTRALAALVALTGVMTLVALTFARLSRRFPDAGSSYSWIARAYGARGGGYAAWLLLLSNFFATMTTALPAAVYTLALVAPAHATDPRWDALVGTLWIAASTALLWFGLRPTALLTALFLLVELLVLAASALCALAIHAPPEHFSSAALAAARPALLPGLGGIAAAMVLGIWMTDGWEVSASASEETRGSNATAGRGGLLGLLVTAAILIGAMAAYFRVGSVTGFVANQSDALGYVAQRLGGGPWTFALDATVLVSSGSALWTTMLYLSRSVYAM